LRDAVGTSYLASIASHGADQDTYIVMDDLDPAFAKAVPAGAE